MMKQKHPQRLAEKKKEICESKYILLKFFLLWSPFDFFYWSLISVIGKLYILALRIWSKNGLLSLTKEYKRVPRVEKWRVEAYRRMANLLTYFNKFLFERLVSIFKHESLMNQPDSICVYPVSEGIS